MELTKKKIFIIVGVLACILLILSIWVRSLSNKTVSIVPSATPTPTAYDYLDPTSKSQVYKAPGQSLEYQKSVEQIYQLEKPIHEREGRVGDLLTVLPYTGTYFSMSYDVGRLTFVVKIDKNNEEKGNQEFAEFLKSHNIADKSWIRNLEISSQ